MAGESYEYLGWSNDEHKYGIALNPMDGGSVAIIDTFSDEEELVKSYEEYLDTGKVKGIKTVQPVVRENGFVRVLDNIVSE